MAGRTAATSPASELKTLSDDFVRIEKGALISGNTSFQIRNIASLVVRANTDSIWNNLQEANGALQALILLFIVIPIMVLMSILTSIFGWRKKYELALLTNAATSYRFLSNDEAFLRRVKDAIEAAMHNPDGVSIQMNIAEQKVEKFESNTVSVNHSPGAAVIGGSAVNASQSTNVIAQGLQDVAQLISLVEESRASNAAGLTAHLEVVRLHLAGVRSKDEAKAAWQVFMEQIGAVAKAGTDIWGLVARIGGILG